MINLDGVYIGLLRKTELGLVEVDSKYSNYRRIEMTAMDWLVLDEAELIINCVNVVFPFTKNIWGYITNFGIFDSPTKGNLLLVGIINPPKLVAENDLIGFEVGKLNVPFETIGIIK